MGTPNYKGKNKKPKRVHTPRTNRTWKTTPATRKRPYKNQDQLRSNQGGSHTKQIKNHKYRKPTNNVGLNGRVEDPDQPRNGKTKKPTSSKRGQRVDEGGAGGKKLLIAQKRGYKRSGEKGQKREKQITKKPANTKEEKD